MNTPQIVPTRSLTVHTAGVPGAISCITNSRQQIASRPASFPCLHNLSSLPGRVRFECAELVGRPDICSLMESAIAATKGVSEASANHRTGRVLVHFNGNIISWSDVQKKARMVWTATDTAGVDGAADILHVKHKTRQNNDILTGIARDLCLNAVQSILPKPFSLLLKAVTASAASPTCAACKKRRSEAARLRSIE